MDYEFTAKRIKRVLAALVAVRHGDSMIPVMIYFMMCFMIPVMIYFMIGIYDTYHARCTQKDKARQTSYV